MTPGNHAAPEALAAFGLDEADDVTPLTGGISGAGTWLVERAGQRFALRASAPGTPIDEVVSELRWLSALRAVRTVRIPAPIRRDDGRLAPWEGPDGGARLWAAFHWVAGTTLGRLPDADEAQRTGAMIAELHVAADGWARPAGFCRPSYGGSWLEAQSDELLGRVDVHRLDARATDLLRRAVGVAIAALDAQWRRSGAIGLIHADVHDGNVVWDDGDPRPGLIDFARFGTGPFALDVAMAMHYVTDDEAEAIRAGYDAVRPLSDAEVRALPALRFAAAIDNLAVLAAIPTEADNVRADLPYLLDLAQTFTSLA